MRLSTTLTFYVGRHFLIGFLGLFVAILMLIYVFDAAELLRKAQSRPNVTLPMVGQMALLKLPHMAQKTFPFMILFAGMLSFWRLTRSHELVVTRAAGVSAWQFLLPALLLAFLLGVFKVAAFNPLSSATLSLYERMEAKHLKGQKSALAIFQAGVWLRQSYRDGQAVVHANRLVQKSRDVVLRDVVVFLYEGSDQFLGRIDAKKATLKDGFWYLNDVWMHRPEEASTHQREYWLETDLTLSRIQDSFAPPETMSFWELPAFINTLENAGFSAVRHRLHWHSLLAAPFLMCAMILIGATFTLRHARRGGTTLVIFAGAMTGFVLYFFSDIVFALGLSDSLPVALAAWSPSGVALLLGLAMLLHLEDG